MIDGKVRWRLDPGVGGIFSLAAYGGNLIVLGDVCDSYDPQGPQVCSNEYAIVHFDQDAATVPAGAADGFRPLNVGKVADRSFVVAVQRDAGLEAADAPAKVVVLAVGDKLEQVGTFDYPDGEAVFIGSPCGVPPPPGRSGGRLQPPRWIEAQRDPRRPDCDRRRVRGAEGLCRDPGRATRSPCTGENRPRSVGYDRLVSLRWTRMMPARTGWALANNRSTLTVALAAHRWQRTVTATHDRAARRRCVVPVRPARAEQPTAESTGGLDRRRPTPGLLPETRTACAAVVRAVFEARGPRAGPDRRKNPYRRTNRSSGSVAARDRRDCGGGPEQRDLGTSGR